MSVLTRSAAFELKRGDILYHNIIYFGDRDTPEDEKEAATCKVMGSAKPHAVYGYVLPIKQLYGEQHVTEITEYTQSLWRTTKDKPARVSRVRQRVREELEQVASRSASRVRRTRS